MCLSFFSDKCCVLTPENLRDLGGLLKRNPRARFLKFGSEQEAWAALEDDAATFVTSPVTAATTDSPLRERNKEVDTVTTKRRSNVINIFK